MKSSIGGLLNPKPEKISSTKDSISQVDAQIDSTKIINNYKITVLKPKLIYKNNQPTNSW